MGAGPNETEMRMFFILTIAFAIGGLVFGAFAIEFLDTPITTWGEDVSGEASTPSGAVTALLGLTTMFIPGLAFAWLPVWFATFLTILQIIWIYLLYAVVVRPLIPLT